MQAGATVYFSSSGSSWSGGDGLIGWDYGSGRVLSFSILARPGELGNADYGQLFSNAVAFAAGWRRRQRATA